MITERLSTRDIKRAAELLREGAVVAVPTETVYGLAASAKDNEAIKKVFVAKGRPQDNPLIVHISDMQMLDSVAKDIPDLAYTLAELFWPGPFTMVLKRADGIDKSVSAGLDTVAVRMPSEPVICDIIRQSGLPLAAPSANTSGAPSPTTAAHVINDLDGKIDAVVMGNDCTVGVESTVVAILEDGVHLLRPGAVTAEQLRAAVPELIIDSAVLAEPEKNKPVASPGMKYKHYAPKTETYLVEATSEQFAELVNSKAGCVALCFENEFDSITADKICYGSADDEATLARGVFSALRECDNKNATAVYVHAPSKTGVGLAVYNRLIRAAAFRVIKL